MTSTSTYQRLHRLVKMEDLALIEMKKVKIEASPQIDLMGLIVQNNLTAPRKGARIEFDQSTQLL